MKNIFDLDIQSSLKYRIIFILGCCMHITFFVIFVFFDVYILAQINILSIAFYATATLRSRKEHFEKHIIGWITATYLEITMHAVLCTIWLGFESCFFIYSLIVLTLTAYFLYLACDYKKFISIIMPFAGITFVTITAVFVYLLFFPPIFTGVFNNTLGGNALHVMKGVNIFFNGFIIFVFSLTFIAEMNLLMKKLNESNERLNYIADHDALTGLYNRRSFYRLFNKLHGRNEEEEEISELKIEKISDSFCVIMGDIDNFKRINDTYGHTCGDDIFKVVSDILKNGVNGNDIACRWGGEEFLIIMSGRRDDCIKRVEEIRERVREFSTVSGDTVVSATMTFGLADCFERLDGGHRPSAASIDELVQIADNRLYYGKRNGKNVVVVQ